MGGACSAITEAMGVEVPEIEVDEAAVERIVQKSGKKIATKAQANFKKFPVETEKCSKKKPPQAFVVPEVKDMTLEFDKAEKKDYVKASVLAAAGQPVKDEITKEVWSELEPDLKNQVPSEVPSSVRQQALNKCRDKTVKPMVNKSVDKMLQKIIEKMNNSDDPSASDEEERKTGE